MRQVCTEEYWAGMESLMPEEAPCGKHFDDEFQLTHCPHQKFADPKVSVTEPDALKKMLQEEIEKVARETNLPSSVKAVIQSGSETLHHKSTATPGKTFTLVGDEVADVDSVHEVQEEDQAAASPEPEKDETPAVEADLQGVSEPAVPGERLKELKDRDPRGVAFITDMFFETLIVGLGHMEYDTVSGKRTVRDDCSKLIEQMRMRIDHWKRLKGLP